MTAALPVATSQAPAGESPGPSPDVCAGCARQVRVPLDHDQPRGPQGTLDYELGAPFDPAKPTVLVVADGQQFYVRHGRMATVQEDFGAAFNVVGLFGRGATPQFLDAAVGPDGATDWERAWRLFRSAQWIDDLEAVRVDLLGKNGRVLLYGASGGGLLVQEYLARHPEHIVRAFTACAVNPYDEGRLGFLSDRFWDEIGAQDPGLHAALQRALERHRADRAMVIMTLQRQNFFVPPDRLAEARATLISALDAGDDEAYAAARRDYQVEAVSGFFDSKEGIPTRVRLYELFQPSGSEGALADRTRVFPDLENQRNFAAPLLELLRAGKIPPPRLDFEALHRVSAEVMILSGRLDHTVDYRAAIALAAAYPRGMLFLADDDHMFARMKEDHSRDRLMQAFLLHGPGSAPFRAALEAASAHRWTER
jgi:pimeloyl-ACP methyl ester carboxylesterase